MKRGLKKKRPRDEDAPPIAEAEDTRKYSVAKRWSKLLAKGGHTTVVNYFLEHYHHLKPYHITSGEAMFIIHLMCFKWGEDAPYPGYKRIAERMGVSHKTARRHAQSLEQKKYLHREMRESQPNIFHLDKLIKALEDHKRANPEKRSKRYVPE
jgi:DNA-binding MarR family transcriptional regulator